jgi:hypothetical protein
MGKKYLYSLDLHNCETRTYHLHIVLRWCSLRIDTNLSRKVRHTRDSSRTGPWSTTWQSCINNSISSWCMYIFNVYMAQVNFCGVGFEIIQEGSRLLPAVSKCHFHWSVDRNSDENSHAAQRQKCQCWS